MLTNLTESPSRRRPSSHKSLKKLAQALRSVLSMKTEHRTHVPTRSLAQKHSLNLNGPVRPNVPNQSMKACRFPSPHAKPKKESKTRTYAERIRRLVGPPEPCNGAEENKDTFLHETLRKARRPRNKPVPDRGDDDSPNSETRGDPEESGRRRTNQSPT